MRNLKYIILTIVTSLFLIGCGSGELKEDPFEKKLVVGEKINVYPGDELVPYNNTTVIDVEHTLDNDVKSVTLITGKATLVRGNYNVQE